MNSAEQELLDLYFSQLQKDAAMIPMDIFDEHLKSISQQALARIARLYRPDWNYDLCEIEGPSMTCPFCGESEDVHYNREMKYGGGYYECWECGAFQEDEGKL